MHKCPKCGIVYEGNFCPNCGTQWQEDKYCPQCRAKLNGSANFCNNCGYSFTQPAKKEKPAKNKDKNNSFVNWIKPRLKIIIPIAAAIALVIILACSIPACIASQANDIYYMRNYRGEIDKTSYFILKYGKWEFWGNNDGLIGTYEKNGENITFQYEKDSVLSKFTGTLKNKVLTVENAGTFISEKHKHKYEDWQTTKEPTCTREGTQTGYCVCGAKDTKQIEALGHNISDSWSIDYTDHYKTCTVCGTKLETKTHIGTDKCSVCGYIYGETIGLEFTLNGDNKSYFVSGKTVKDSSIKIPSTYNSLPVICIADRAFVGCQSLTNITIPDSITTIEGRAFYNCSNLPSIDIPSSVTSLGNLVFGNCSKLTDINFNGSKAQWNAIEKGFNWDYNTGDYTVHCTDGDIKKS